MANLGQSTTVKFGLALLIIVTPDSEWRIRERLRRTDLRGHMTWHPFLREKINNLAMSNFLLKHVGLAVTFRSDSLFRQSLSSGCILCN